jgi:hypothetical protein
MNVSFSIRSRQSPDSAQGVRLSGLLFGGAFACALVVSLAALLAVLLAATPASAQITIDTHTGAVTNGATGPQGTVDRRYQQIKPTHVALTKSELDPKTRLELIRLLQSEQGFAMRPFPRGHKGLTLQANGKLEPAGEAYLNMVTSQGMSAKPGDRVVLTDIKFEHSRIVFDLNGGPDAKHRFLRHVQVGVGGPDMTDPVVQGGQENEPVGSRLTLAFDGHVPELTGTDVKALLSPLISFDVKTPIQAYTDTLPTKLKEAILDHHVLVGMSTDMVLFAKGAPEGKSREMEGQMPFEEWMYGKAPDPVEFVRINGNRVIRVEVAKVGEKPVIFTEDEVEGLMRTDGTPLDAGLTTTRTVAEGDVQRDPDKQAPAAPPSLRNPGEKLPTDDDKTQVMRPVQFPKPHTDDQNTTQPGTQPSTQPSTAAQPGSSQPNGTQPAPASGQAAPATPPAGTQPAPADGSQPAPPTAPASAPAKPQQMLPSATS